MSFTVVVAVDFAAGAAMSVLYAWLIGGSEHFTLFVANARE